MGPVIPRIVDEFNLRCHQATDAHAIVSTVFGLGPGAWLRSRIAINVDGRRPSDRRAVGRPRQY